MKKNKKLVVDMSVRLFKCHVIMLIVAMIFTFFFGGFLSIEKPVNGYIFTSVMVLGYGFFLYSESVIEARKNFYNANGRKEELDLLEHVRWLGRAVRCANDAHGMGTVDAALHDVLHQDFMDVLHEFFVQRAAFSDELAYIGEGTVVVRDLVHLAEFLAANGNAVLEQHFRFHKGKRVAFDLRRVMGIRHVEGAVVVVEHVRRQCAGDAGHIGLESVKGLVVEAGHSVFPLSASSRLDVL